MRVITLVSISDGVVQGVRGVFNEDMRVHLASWL